MTNIEKIEELDLSMYYDDGDSVEENLVDIQKKINEIIRVLNSRK
jgi:hypothetical protein